MLATPQEDAAPDCLSLPGREPFGSEATVSPGSSRLADLAMLAEAIRADAQQDTLHYLLRSNTSHDGE